MLKRLTLFATLLCAVSLAALAPAPKVATVHPSDCPGPIPGHCSACSGGYAICYGFIVHCTCPPSGLCPARAPKPIR